MNSKKIIATMSKMTDLKEYISEGGIIIMSGQRKTTEPKYEFLKQLSIEELESLLTLRADAEEMEVFLDRVATVIIERERENPTGRLPNIDDAWNEFQTFYATPDNIAQHKNDEVADIDRFLGELDKTLSERKPSHRPVRRILRTAAVVAASVALTFAVMICAQAAGTDLFGALAEWTDETFRFVPKSDLEENPVKAALRQQGIPEDLAPTFIPEGFQLQKLESQKNDYGCFIVAAYTNGDNMLGIEIDKYDSPQKLGVLEHQKDKAEVEKYISHKMEFYILSNLNDTTATWSDNHIMVSIWGNISTEVMKEIINSIGG